MRRGWICWPGNSTGPWPGGWGCPESRWKRPPRPSERWTPTLWGRGQSKGRRAYLRPDAWVAEIDGTLQVFVNQWDLPQFHLSPAYLQMAREDPGGEAADYLRQKIQQARWVLQCVRRRQETLTRCLTALVAAQEDFFRGRTSVPGPLLGRELAETLGLHPSTVSRTLGHKALQCRQGVFPLGWFFGRAVGEGLSPQGVQARIAQLVAEEDSRCPYSDQELMERLQAEGIPVARRTVAKYRQALGLPPSYRRKR